MHAFDMIAFFFIFFLFDDYGFHVIYISEKPGVCPGNNHNTSGVCVGMCFHDGECLNDEKCCSNGCGYQCMPPYKGSCPKPVGAGLCAEMCSGDSSCPNNQKCCSNGCGRQCMAPYTGIYIILIFFLFFLSFFCIYANNGATPEKP
uniref:WAP domain-containing protein n=1 Tax=Cyprinus carpio TaxID=7962 RepID=A0A8C1S4Q6_CYPCA